MTVEVTDLNLSPEEIQILMLESAVEASRRYEEQKFLEVVKATRAWERAKNDLDKLNRLIADKRDEWLRRTV
jgi:hypothetical protein